MGYFVLVLLRFLLLFGSWKLIVVFVKYSLLETSQVGSLEVGHSV